MSRARRVALTSAFVIAAFYTAWAQGPAASRPVEPTPRLADGTPNLGRVPGEKGVWNVPYIQNMGMRIPGPDGRTAAERGAVRTCRSSRGRAASTITTRATTRSTTRKATVCRREGHV